MRRLVLYPVATIVTALLFSLNSPNSNSSNNSDLNFLKRTIPDSVLTMIEDKPMILYMTGNHAHLWSAIIKNDRSFLAMNGRIDSQGKNTIANYLESNNIDSLALFSRYQDLILWGLDSLPSEVKRMVCKKSQVNTLFYQTINIIQTKPQSSYQSDTNVIFSGNDSIGFNKKFKSLSYLMFWLAEPLVRPYSPDSIYLK